MNLRPRHVAPTLRSRRAAHANYLARVALILLASLALLPLALAGAQAPRTEDAVRIALVDELSITQARAEVVRSGAGREPDIVLLRASDATVEDLGAAIAMLRRMRQDASPASRNVRATLTGAARSTPIPESRRAALRRALETVRAAPESEIAPLGRGRWAEFANAKLER